MHIIPNLRKGGAERICLDICHELLNQGHKVKLVILENEIEYESLSKGIDTIYISARPYIRKKSKNDSGIEKLIQYTLDFNPDIVHTHLFFAEFTWKCTKLPIHSIFHIHSNIPVFVPLKGSKAVQLKLTQFLEKRKYHKLNSKQPSHFLSISKSTFDFTNKVFPNAKNRIHFIPNAINYQRFFYSGTRSLDSINLITIGSLVKKKGHAFLIDIVKLLVEKRNKKVNLIILGDGPEKTALSKKIQDLGLENNISLLGKVEHPENYLIDSNMYIHGATSEPFGLVLIESMASGLPVFSTDGKGNRDIVINQKNGFFYEERNASKIAEDILSLSENEEQYKSLSFSARDFAKKFDIKPYVNNLTELYQKIIDSDKVRKP